MKSLIPFMLVFGAASATAGENCNLHVDTGLRISSAALEFYDKEKTVYQIKDHQYLVVDGKQLNLDDAQRSLVTQYDKSVRALVPEVKGMALDGIDLAIVGVTTAFDNLLGEHNKISTQLSDELNHLKGDVRRYFESDVINLGREQDGAPELFGQYFETRMERIVETSVQDSVADILLALGKEIFNSGGDMDAFGARMEKFGKEMEVQMQARGAELEVRGASLCRAAVAVNSLEDELRKAVPAIEAIDLIRLDISNSRNAAVNF